MFQDLEAITVLEFGNKPDEDAKLNVSIELPASSFSLCFQMYLMQHTNGFAPLDFGEDAINLYFRTKDFDLPSWFTLFGSSYSFAISENILEMYQWTGVCLSVRETSFEVFMKGLQVVHEQRLDSIQTNVAMLNSLKFEPSVKYKMTNIYIWSQALNNQEIKRLTKQCKVSEFLKENVLFDLDSLYGILEKFNTVKISQEKLCSISQIHYFAEIKATFDKAHQFCQSLGGQMYLPITEDELNAIPNEYALRWFWVPLRYRNDNWINVNSDDKVDIVPWNPGQPNNGRNEPCVLLKNRKMSDAPCSPLKMPFSCQFTSIQKFTFRGLSKDMKIDRVYVIDHSKGTFNNHLVFQGLTFGQWMVHDKLNNSWVILDKEDFLESNQSGLLEDSLGFYSLGAMDYLPTGKANWTIRESSGSRQSVVLKFTQCNVEKTNTHVPMDCALT